MQIGFACLWDRVPAATWSYTPWHLRRAMRRHTPIVDVGIRMSTQARMALTAMHLRPQQGRLLSVWQQSRLTDAYCRREIMRELARHPVDAVLEIQDLAPLPLPFYLFQDMSFDALLQMHDIESLPIFRRSSVETLRRRRDRQAKVYAEAAGVLAMSRWLARSLVEVSGLPADKVHVVYPGVSAAAAGEVPPRRDRPRRRLLFVGREFHRKGGDMVVAALRILRRDVDSKITLTVAGPAGWPLRGDVPDGVEFIGNRPLGDVTSLYDTHDLFVMPSRVEPFGIVFVEAAARGLPCVGRDAFAMPELIRPGVTGALVTSEDPTELADVIARTLTDDELYEACRAGAGTVAERFSWDRAARDAIAAMTGMPHEETVRQETRP